MQGDDIGFLQEFMEALHRASVAHGQFGNHIVVDDLHAKCLGEDGDLRADVPIAHDAHGLAAHLVASDGALGPLALVHGVALIAEASKERDGLGHNQLGDAAGVGMGGVKHWDAPGAGDVQIDLIGANAKTADAHELVGGVQHWSPQLGS